MRLHLGPIIIVLSCVLPNLAFGNSCHEFYNVPNAYRSIYNLPFDHSQISRSIWKIAIPAPTKENANRINLATFFFISSQGHFITNMHTFEGQIKALVEKGLVDLSQGYNLEKGEIQVRFRQPVIIHNQELKKTIEVTDLFFNVIPKVKNEFKFGQPPESDFIIGRIDQTIDSWIPLRSGQLAGDEKFYSMGYPYSDARVERSTSGADGRFKVSSGKIIKKIFTSLTTRDVFISDAPYAGGGSGSPAFNSKGELIGLITGGGLYGKRDVSSFLSSVAIVRLLNKHSSLADLLLLVSRSPKALAQSLNGVTVSKDGLQIHWPEHLTSNDAYEVLGIDTSVTPHLSDKEIKVAYRKLTLKYHPDRAISLLNEIKVEFPQITLSEKDVSEELDTIFKKIKSSYDLIENSGLRAVYDLGRKSAKGHSFFDFETSPPPRNEFNLLQELAQLSAEQRLLFYSRAYSATDFTRMIFKNYHAQPESIAVASQYLKEYYDFKYKNRDHTLETELETVFNYEMVVKSLIADVNEGKHLIDLIAYQESPFSLRALDKIIADLRFKLLDFKKMHALSNYAKKIRAVLKKKILRNSFITEDPILLLEYENE